MEYIVSPETCAAHLSALVQFPTLSCDHEADMDFTVFRAMHDRLAELYPLVHRTLTREIIGKAGLLYRWKGTGKSNALPVLLMAHQDVVPEGSHDAWRFPPYSGTVADGQVWGRGSADCKANIVSQMETLEYLIGQGWQPDYDIYLAYGYNEEVSGGDAPSAAKLIADTLISRGIRIGYAFDEGGGIQSAEKSGTSIDLCAPCVAEKGYADFEISRRDPGGHSARPHHGGALDYVAEAILAIRDNQFPYRFTEPVRQRFEAAAPYMTGNPELSALMSDIPGNWEKLIPYIDADPALAAQFHTTMVPTMTSASRQANILPEKASVTVNCRLMAGDTLEGVKKHLESIVPDGMDVKLLKGSEPSPYSSIDNPVAQLMLDACRKVYGDMILIPDTQVGGTDAKFMYEAAEHVYRFESCYDPKGLTGRAHQVNETMSVDALAHGPLFYRELLMNYAVVQA